MDAGRSSAPLRRADTDRMGRSALLSAAVVVVCLIAAVGGFVGGRSGAPDLVAARRTGTLIGARAGARTGNALGRRAGYRVGFTAGYRHAYGASYRAAYRRALGP